jgi:hypothetical protein
MCREREAMKIINTIRAVIAARKRAVDPNEGAWAGYYGHLDDMESYRLGRGE